MNVLAVIVIFSFSTLSLYSATADDLLNQVSGLKDKVEAIKSLTEADVPDEYRIHLTEEDIGENSTLKTFNRGQDIYLKVYVTRNNTITATMATIEHQGSDLARISYLNADKPSIHMLHKNPPYINYYIYYDEYDNRYITIMNGDVVQEIILANDGHQVELMPELDYTKEMLMLRLVTPLWGSMHELIDQSTTGLDQDIP